MGHAAFAAGDAGCGGLATGAAQGAALGAAGGTGGAGGGGWAGAGCGGGGLARRFGFGGLGGWFGLGRRRGGWARFDRSRGLFEGRGFGDLEDLGIGGDGVGGGFRFGRGVG